MTPEQERWAEALAVIATHGGGAESFITERIAALVGTGDAAGIARWQEIGRHVAAVRQAAKHRRQ